MADMSAVVTNFRIRDDPLAETSSTMLLIKSQTQVGYWKRSPGTAIVRSISKPHT